MASFQSGFDEINELVTVLQNYRDTQNMFAGDMPPVTPYDVLQMLNDDTTVFDSMMEQVRAHPGMYGEGEMLGKDMASPTYVQRLHDEWRFLPSDITILETDYNQIVKYFRNEITGAQLTEKQFDVLESLSFKGDDFSVNSGLFDFEHDAVNGYNLREQLIGMLERDNVLNRNLMDRIIESQAVENPPDFPPENWSYKSVDPHYQVPGVSSQSRPPATAPKRRFWFQEDDAFMRSNAEEMFKENFDASFSARKIWSTGSAFIFIYSI